MPSSRSMQAATAEYAVQKLLTPPNTEVYNSSSVPQLASLPSVQAGTCNSYLPSTSTLDRFKYIVDFLAANGLYVVRPPAVLPELRMTGHSGLQIHATQAASDTRNG